MVRTQHLVAALFALVTAVVAPGARGQTLPAPAQQAARTVSYNYDLATGLLIEERIEPDTPSLCVVTTHAYADGYGNRTSSTTQPCTGATPATTRTASVDFVAGADAAQGV